MTNLCPVCGYTLPFPPAEYHICPSCGTEFGVDDENHTYAELRAAWLRGGARWWSPNTPARHNWDPYLQIDNIISLPDLEEHLHSR